MTNSTRVGNHNIWGLPRQIRKSQATYAGISPYCITIDEEAMDYLPQMFEAVNFTVVSEVQKLPYKVSDIYRRITH